MTKLNTSSYKYAVSKVEIKLCEITNCCLCCEYGGARMRRDVVRRNHLRGDNTFNLVFQDMYFLLILT